MVSFMFVRRSVKNGGLSIVSGMAGRENNRLGVRGEEGSFAACL